MNLIVYILFYKFVRLIVSGPGEKFAFSVFFHYTYIKCMLRIPEHKKGVPDITKDFYYD